MKRKAILMTTAIFAIALFFAGCGDGAQKGEETSTTKDEEKVEVAKEKTTSGKPGNMEDAFVEITALSMYLLAEQGKLENPLEPSAHFVKLAEEVEKEMEKLRKEFGTEEEWEAYEEQLEEITDPAKAIKLSQRLQKRALELQEERK